MGLAKKGAKKRGELLLKDARLVDVEEGAIRRADIGIDKGRFVLIREITKGPGNDKGAYRKTIDCRGRFIVPGLIDSHTHTELSLMTVAPFSEMVTREGTTAAIMDCHDLVNVIGARGLDLLIKESKGVELRCFFTVPPCVPSTMGFEDATGSINAGEVQKALKRPEVVGLGEVMDLPRLFRKERALMAMIRAAREAGKVVDGHCPSLSKSEERKYFRLSGAATDHESTTVGEIKRKLRLGKWVHLRRTSFGMEYPLKGLFDGIRSGETGGERLMLSTDGVVSPVDVYKEGHLSAFVAELIRDGVDPLLAIRAATLNPARCYGLGKEIGAVREGMRADFFIVKDLKRFRAERTFIGGEEVGKKKLKRYAFPAYTRKTIKARPVTADRIKVKAPGGARGKKRVAVEVIGVSGGTLVTKRSSALLENASGTVACDPSRDILKAVVMERSGRKGGAKSRPRVAFIKGFGLKNGAFGGSIGQDSQHIVVVGANDDDRVKVIDEIIKDQGGLYYVSDGKVVARVKLPIGGIMTDEGPRALCMKIKKLDKELGANGCTMRSPYLALSLNITLAAIPELKLTNRGLLDVRKGRFIDPVKKVSNR